MFIRKNSGVLICFFRFFSVITMFLCIIMSMITDKFTYPYWILTINYVIFICFIKDNVIYKSPGIIVLNVVMFCRYVILPLTFCFSNELTEYARNYDHMFGALVILTYEQICLFVAIYITGKREKKIHIRDCDDYLYDLKYGNIILIFILGALLLFALKYRELLGGFSLITKGSISVESSIENTSGFVGILWEVFWSWLYIYINFKIKEKNFYNKSIKNFLVIVIALIYILITFIGQTSISRWYTVISFCAVYFTLLKLYKKDIKKISLGIFIPFLFLIMIVSVFKNSSYLEGDMSFKNSILEVFNSKNLDSYLAGAVSVNNSLGLWFDTNASIFSAPIDILNNMPIVNHWIDNSNGSITLYNQYIGRFWNGAGDQIIPLVGQSLVYFSPLLSPLLSIISLKIIRYFDRKYMQSKSLDMYFYAFSSAWIGVGTILNLTIIMSWVYIRVIPTYFIIKITEFTGTIKKKILD